MLRKSLRNLNLLSTTFAFSLLQSYSHHDKELVYQIEERLEKDKFRVWLDRDNMFGSATRAMAQAIENSEVTPKRNNDLKTSQL